MGRISTSTKEKSNFFGYADPRNVATAPQRSLNCMQATAQKPASWNVSFFSAVNMLKVGVPRDERAVRLFTDSGIPKALVDASGVEVFDQIELAPADKKRGLPPIMGEAFTTGARGGSPTGAPPSKPVTILFCHGGAYTAGSPKTHRQLLAELALSTGATVMAVEYRRAPENPYPAARDDVTRAYRALLASGVPARSLVLAGDSAGGGLVLSAMLSLRDGSVELPAAAVLLSPWVDLTDFSSRSWTTNWKVDWLPKDMARIAAKSYAGGVDPAKPGISPARADLSGLPPMLIEVGEREVLRDQIDSLAERATAAGVEVQYTASPDMVHDFLMLRIFADPSSCPQPNEAMARVADFVLRTTGDPSDDVARNRLTVQDNLKRLPAPLLGTI